MFKGWLSTKKASLSGSTNSLNSVAESQNLEDAMSAATHIMNDDLDSAEAGLKEGVSSFHKLGRGMITFMRATLGFEPEIMRQASERLADAEATAASEHKKAQRERNAFQSSIYPPGSEYALCHAETQLMSAVVGVLNENLMESIKGFYKLRKAYLTLDGILDAEHKYMTDKGTSALSTTRNSIDSLKSPISAETMKNTSGSLGSDAPNIAISREKPPGGSSEGVNGAEKGMTNIIFESQDDQDDGDDEFYDANEDAKQEGGAQEITTRLMEMEVQILKSPYEKPQPTPTSLRSTKNYGQQMQLNHNPDSEVFSNPIDLFVHSGANLCYGMLLLIISLIPPAFGKLLFIIGFRGDRERGLRMLWQASKFHNINGAMAGLVVFGYYNTIVGFCDIIPDPTAPTSELSDNVEGFPRQRLEALLADMRTRYPKSQLWLLEEARMHASNRHLDTAISLLNGGNVSPLKQVEALKMFEKSMEAMYAHRFELCTESFTKCCELNNWSHALYYYIAGACQVELYRQAKSRKDLPVAKVHAERAVNLMQNVRAHAGKKKFMARQLPFDVFVVRKLNKWDARAKEWDVPFIDAIGVSPIEEMIYLWNGQKRMDPMQLQETLTALAWSEDTNENPTWLREGLDEHAILALLRAATFRNCGRFKEAKALLEKEIVRRDKASFKGSFRDDWTNPTAHYEMAANLWAQRARDGGEGDREKVKEAEIWVDKAAKWEGYELDARIGMKVTTGLETVKKWRAVYDT